MSLNKYHVKQTIKSDNSSSLTCRLFDIHTKEKLSDFIVSRYGIYSNALILGIPYYENIHV